MATNKVTPIQLLRSEVLNKRPDPTKLLSGQPAVNINSSEPGFYFADNTGTSLFKVGPCAIGSTSPNAGVAHTKGELWLDTSDPRVPALKVYDGASWQYASPPTLVSDTAPLLGTYPDNSMWWDSSTGLMYILYNDGSSRQWTQISTSVVA